MAKRIRVYWLVAFACCLAGCLARRAFKNNYIEHPIENEENNEFYLTRTYPAHRVKKETIAPSGNYFKRGFLANLASLLTDADLMTNKNSLAAKNTITPTSSKVKSEPTENSVTAPSVSEKAVIKSLSPKHENDNNSPTPSAGKVERTLKTEGKDSAPIFALFHGKIVPLGKLPDTSFKKSHPEGKNEENETPKKEEGSRKEEGSQPEEKPQKDDSSKVKTQENDHVKNEVKTPENNEEPRVSKDQNSQQNDDRNKKDKSQALTPSQFSRLTSYFHNLDSKSKAAEETRMVRNRKMDVTGTAKDDVPELPASVKNSEFLKHVKGIVMDNGKLVTFKGKKLEEEQATEPDKSEEASIKPEEQGGPEKSYDIDGRLLSQLTKSKDKTSDPIARDTQSVTLNVDTLKGLLKKSNDGVSLAKLLNKQPEEAVVNTQEEDPGTIEDFAAGGLKKTNDYRAEHHSPPLVWSDELASEAQKMAEHLADFKSLEISSDLEKKGFGENVAKVWANFKTAGESATNMWYHQSENYHFEDPHLDQNTGQFAQLIWKDSKELGMGVAKSIDDINNKYVYVVALYRPPGNIETMLRNNVLRSGNDTTDVYATFFKRSNALRHKGVLLPRHIRKIVEEDSNKPDNV